MALRPASMLLDAPLRLELRAGADDDAHTPVMAINLAFGLTASALAALHPVLG